MDKNKQKMGTASKAHTVDIFDDIMHEIFADLSDIYKQFQKLSKQKQFLFLDLMT